MCPLCAACALSHPSQGKTGRVHYDHVTGDRYGLFHLVNLRPSGTKEVVAEQQETIAVGAAARRGHTRALLETGTIFYPTNSTEFSNRVQYSLMWSSGLSNATVFKSDNSGQPLVPMVVISVLQEDGLAITYAKEVSGFETDCGRRLGGVRGGGAVCTPHSGHKEQGSPYAWYHVLQLTPCR